MIDLRHPLAVLAARLPRSGIEAALANGCVAQRSLPLPNLRADKYWSGKEYAPWPNSNWSFNTSLGNQGAHTSSHERFVPAILPPSYRYWCRNQKTYALLLTGLGLLAWMTRRRHG